MKKLLSVFVALAFVLVVSGAAMAADNAATGAGPAKAAPAEKPAKAEKKAKAKRIHGTIESVDAAAGTITLKGRKGKTLTLKAGEKVQNLADFKAGDKVTVVVSGDVAEKIKAASAKKKGGKKAEKKEAAPAAPPAPVEKK